MDSASWTCRTVWGSGADHRWSITARSRSPRRVCLAMFAHLLCNDARILRLYYRRSYRCVRHELATVVCGGKSRGTGSAPVMALTVCDFILWLGLPHKGGTR